MSDKIIVFIGIVVVVLSFGLLIFSRRGKPSKGMSCPQCEGKDSKMTSQKVIELDKLPTDSFGRPSLSAAEQKLEQHYACSSCSHKWSNIFSKS